VKYYLIDVDYDAKGNAPWDAVWHTLSYDALDCLRGSLPLAAIWKSPKTILNRQKKRPDVFDFLSHFAVTKAVRDLLAKIVGEEAEFLPLKVPELDLLFVIHPLWPIDFDKRAVVQCNEVSGNITAVRKYSFTIDPSKYDRPRHLFRMRQAKDSAARNAGSTLTPLIVSETVKEAMQKAKVQGIVFKQICSA